MIKHDITITNKLGLHTRAAAKIVNITKKHHSNISIQCNGISADAKSIIELLTLAATKNSIVTVTIDGIDEEVLYNELRALILNKFDENE